jgi:hypothetical protein
MGAQQLLAIAGSRKQQQRVATHGKGAGLKSCTDIDVEK